MYMIAIHPVLQYCYVIARDLPVIGVIVRKSGGLQESWCAPIVWGFQWRLRITCGFAGLWKRRTWPVSSSDCVGISGEVEDCMRICRIVWREVKRGGSGRWRETCRRVGVP